MNKKHCVNCSCKLYPNRHIVNQRYCSRRQCQNTRRREWMRRKLRHDEDYKANQKEAQHKWKTNNPDYWVRYKKNTPAGNGINKRTAKQKEKSNKLAFKKPILKILLTKRALVNLRKIKSINYDCRIILLS